MSMILIGAVVILTVLDVVATTEFEDMVELRLDCVVTSSVVVMTEGRTTVAVVRGGSFIGCNESDNRFINFFFFVGAFTGFGAVAFRIQGPVSHAVVRALLFAGSPMMSDKFPGSHISKSLSVSGSTSFAPCFLRQCLLRSVYRWVR